MSTLTSETLSTAGSRGTLLPSTTFLYTLTSTQASEKALPTTSTEAPNTDETTLQTTSIEAPKTDEPTFQTASTEAPKKDGSTRLSTNLLTTASAKTSVTLTTENPTPLSTRPTLRLSEAPQRETTLVTPAAETLTTLGTTEAATSRSREKPRTTNEATTLRPTLTLDSSTQAVPYKTVKSNEKQRLSFEKARSLWLQKLKRKDRSFVQTDHKIIKATKLPILEDHTGELHIDSSFESLEKTETETEALTIPDLQSFEISSTPNRPLETSSLAPTPTFSEIFETSTSPILEITKALTIPHLDSFEISSTPSRPLETSSIALTPTLSQIFETSTSPTLEITKSLSKASDHKKENIFKMVQCGDETCIEVYRYEESCALYINDGTDGCHLPCIRSHCQVEYQPEMPDCPVWVCSKSEVTTVSPWTTHGPPAPAYICQGPLCIASVVGNVIGLLCLGLAVFGVLRYRKRARALRRWLQEQDTETASNGTSSTTSRRVEISDIVRRQEVFEPQNVNEQQGVPSSQPATGFVNVALDSNILAEAENEAIRPRQMSNEREEITVQAQVYSQDESLRPKQRKTMTTMFETLSMKCLRKSSENQ